MRCSFLMKSMHKCHESTDFAMPLYSEIVLIYIIASTAQC